MTNNLRRSVIPRGGVPIRLDPSGGVPRTTRLTGALLPITTGALLPITTKYAGRTPIASSITRGGSRAVASSLRTGRGASVLESTRGINSTKVIAPVLTPALALENTATGGVFGGINGGMGSSTPSTNAPLSIGGIGSSITGAGSGIINTIGSVIPLAIKIIAAIIVIKIVWWLIKGRRR